MNQSEFVLQTRKALGLNQTQFGQLLGVHWMTISRWEKGATVPAYQYGLIEQFRKAAEVRKVKKESEDLTTLLITAGAIAGLLLLLNLAAKKK